jgi:transcription elongation factor GreA
LVAFENGSVALMVLHNASKNQRRDRVASSTRWTQSEHRECGKGEKEMAEKEVLLTPEGLQKLEEELEHLKGVKRREVAERIKLAISYGDISENSEYEDAKNEQAFVEGRIMTLEKMLRNARIIHEADVNTDLVSIGSTVALRDVEFDEDVEYTIVGSAEADPASNKISNESPVGRSLLGQAVGSTVEVTVPAGTIRFQILSIKR